MENNAKQSLHEYLVRHTAGRTAFRDYIAQQIKLLRNDLEHGPESKISETRAELRALRKLDTVLRKATQEAKRA